METLVTGGGGFLGGRIVELLLDEGHEVSILARRRYPRIEAMGVRAFIGDVRDRDAVQRAVDGADVVFHTAAVTGFWGPASDFRSINVDGTRNVVDAALGAGVGRLIYTSTPSVVGYAADVEGGAPDLPYARVHEAAYPDSKAEAERLVLKAKSDGLRTVALRPHLIIGPGDTQLMPRIVQRAAAGRLLRVGDGRNSVDLTYVDNAAWAHLDAADALGEPTPACAGRAYFISNGEPVLIWAWLEELLARLGIRGPRGSVPLAVARVLGGAAELAWGALPLDGEPLVTRFLASALSRSHWYDIEPARRDLGYHVRVPMDEATERTAAWLESMLAG